MASKREVVSVTVFDGDMQSGQAWPDMTEEPLTEHGFAGKVRKAKKRAERSGEYADGDVVTVVGWDENGHLADMESFSVGGA